MDAPSQYDAVHVVAGLLEEAAALSRRLARAERRAQWATLFVTTFFRALAPIRLPYPEWGALVVKLAGHAANGHYALCRRLLWDHRVTGICGRCGINLLGSSREPAEAFMPCNIEGCPFERREDQNTDDEIVDFDRLMAAAAEEEVGT